MKTSALVNRVNRLAITSLLLLNNHAWGLGISEIDVQSKLGEPLNARLVLNDTGDLADDQIIIRNAPQEVYRNMGVERTYEAASIKYEPDENHVVVLRTRDPIKEPYLNFVLEIVWPEGKLYREFKVFLDPVH